MTDVIQEDIRSVVRGDLIALLNEDLARGVSGRQCEALGEFAVAEHIHAILVQEQDHQVALAGALGVAFPNVSAGPSRVGVAASL